MRGLLFLSVLCWCCGCSDELPRDPLASPTVASPASPTLSTEAEAPAIALAEPAGIDRLVARIEQIRGLDVGCGVIVRRTESSFDVLTADHLLADGDSYVVIVRLEVAGQLTDRVFKTSDVVLRDPRRDLACLRITSDELPVAAMDVSERPAGAAKTFEAWGVRWKRGEPMQLERLRVVDNMQARRSESTQPVSYWRLAKEVDPGMSGGPLIDSAGKLLGVASGNSDGAAYYVDLREVREFLRAAQ